MPNSRPNLVPKWSRGCQCHSHLISSQTGRPFADIKEIHGVNYFYDTICSIFIKKDTQRDNCTLKVMVSYKKDRYLIVKSKLGVFWPRVFRELRIEIEIKPFNIILT